jgi:hypothetical protein
MSIPVYKRFMRKAAEFILSSKVVDSVAVTLARLEA